MVSGWGRICVANNLASERSPEIDRVRCMFRVAGVGAAWGGQEEGFVSEWIAVLIHAWFMG